MKTSHSKLIIFSRYSISQAATRVRALQYIPFLMTAGFCVEIFPILDDNGIAGRSSLLYLLFSRIRSIARVMFKLAQESESETAIHVHIEFFPWFPFIIERWLLILFGWKKYSVELDDAWFHRYENHSSPVIRYLLGNKIDRIMQSSCLVIAGNRYIAERAIAVGADRVEIIPTVVDMQRYRFEPAFSLEREIIFEPSCHSTKEVLAKMPILPTIGWIGTPATTKHLLGIADAIRRISEADIAQFVAIGADTLQLKGLPIKVIPWSELTEVESIFSFDIGIMPLTDTLFERGKCGYKLIQYMACCLPVVASPVGVNTIIVTNGKNGYLANTQEEWVNLLSKLCISKSLRYNLGQNGFRLVQRSYSLEVYGPKFALLFKNI